MKKQLLAAAAVMGFAAAPALAQDIEFNLGAEVGEFCAVDTSDSTDVNFGDLISTDVGDHSAVQSRQVRYRCNATGGFTRTVESANGGYMVRNGVGLNRFIPTRRIGYDFREGVGPINTAWNTLQSDSNAGIGPLLAWLGLGNGFTTNHQFRAYGVGVDGNSSVFEGDYSDTVTVSLVGNF